jgi:hypothetical protein
MPESAGGRTTPARHPGLLPWETRVVGDTDLDDRRAQPNQLSLWWRVGEHSVTTGVHQALLAFGSELTLIGTALLPHGSGASRCSCRPAHVGDRAPRALPPPVRIDEWLLVTQSSPVATGGSAYGTGHVQREGALVAACPAVDDPVRRLPDGATLLFRTVGAATLVEGTTEGWWTDDTLGAKVAGGSYPAPGATVSVHSAPSSASAPTPTSTTRPAGHRLLRGGEWSRRDRRLPLPNWRGGRVVRRLTMGGYVLVPIVHIYGPKSRLHPL